MTGSFRSSTTTTETSTHGTNGTPVPQRRNIIKYVSKMPKDQSNSDDHGQNDNITTVVKEETLDETLTAQDNT